MNPNMNSSPYPYSHTPDTYEAHSDIFTPMQIPSVGTSSDGITSLSHLSNMSISHMPQQMDYQAKNKPKPERRHSCETCAKCFVRKSDLSRHERIHSGHRPHACDFFGCNKQFIQRSALTIHMRVHTGEKPHICAVCAKSFGDSSSLARHRRTHTGRRDYRCPYAHCQKTFTRKATLNRHQEAHTETLEEASAATAATLAACGIKPATSPRTSTTDDIAQHAPNFQQRSSLPLHLRVGSPISTASSSSSTYSPNSSYAANMLLTSYPAGLVEQQNEASGKSSPLVSSVGWNSPSESGASYVYPDQGACPPDATNLRKLLHYPKHTRCTDPIEAESLLCAWPEEKLGQPMTRDYTWWTLSD